ncbi:MAG: Uma2 family endonuclease [Thermoanaerobaculia bacterium]|nr:Uma2 family endonuclease [Thermoanaerobaculia bacterium]
MVVAPALLKLTYEDFLGFPEDGNRHELLDGDHFVTPAPVPRHQRLVLRLAFALEAAQRTHRLSAQVFPAPIDVVLSPHDVVEPDLVVLREGSSAEVTDTCIEGAPDLVIEVLSDGTRKRDETTKRHLYERHGVTEYWIVDPVLESVKVYRRDGDRFAPPLLFENEAGGVLQTVVLPGLALELGELFGA